MTSNSVVDKTILETIKSWEAKINQHLQHLPIFSYLKEKKDVSPCFVLCIIALLPQLALNVLLMVYPLYRSLKTVNAPSIHKNTSGKQKEGKINRNSLYVEEIVYWLKYFVVLTVIGLFERILDLGSSYFLLAYLYNALKFTGLVVLYKRNPDRLSYFFSILHRIMLPYEDRLKEIDGAIQQKGTTNAQNKQSKTKILSLLKKSINKSNPETLNEELNSEQKDSSEQHEEQPEDNEPSQTSIKGDINNNNNNNSNKTQTLYSQLGALYQNILNSSLMKKL